MYYTKDIQKRNLNDYISKTNPLENVTLSKERGENKCQKIEDVVADSDLEMTAAG